jgi:biotin operon repressor
VSPAKQQFARVPYLLIDSGLIGIVGARCFVVYVTLIRFAWRGTHDDARITKHQKNGELVAWVSQSKLAELLGVARQTVNKDIAVLAAYRLVKVIRLAHNGRAYTIGLRMKNDGRTRDLLLAPHLVEEALGKRGRLRMTLKAIRKRRGRLRRHLALGD